VSSTVFGLKKRRAIYIEGLGAILVNDDYDLNKKFDIPNRNTIAKSIPYPYGNLTQKDTVFDRINYESLKKSIDNSFDDQNENIKKTRSVLVIYKDQIIVEKYADGFDKNTPILGWLMAKSII